MLKSFWVMMVILLLGTAVSFSAAQSEDSPVEGYKLAWSDEFNSDVLEETKWRYWALGPRRNATNVTSAVWLDGQGNLELTTSRVGDNIVAGGVCTKSKFETAFGYFECRVQLQKQIDHWSAFWLYTPTIGKEIGNTAEFGTEIDIFEYLRREGDTVHHTLHWDGYKKDHKSAKKMPRIKGLSKGWHTFGLLWSKNEYVFYVDGKETWRTDKAISKRSEYIILSLEVSKWAGDIAKASLPDSFCVDYVRVYKKAEQPAALDCKRPAAEAYKRLS